MSNLIIRDLVSPEQPISSYETKMIIGGFGEGDLTSCNNCNGINGPLDIETRTGGSSKDGNGVATDRAEPTAAAAGAIKPDKEWVPVTGTK